MGLWSRLFLEEPFTDFFVRLKVSLDASGGFDAESRSLLPQVDFLSRFASDELFSGILSLPKDSPDPLDGFTTDTGVSDAESGRFFTLSVLFLPSVGFLSRFALAELFSGLFSRLNDSLATSGGFASDSGGFVTDSGRMSSEFEIFGRSSSLPLASSFRSFADIGGFAEDSGQMCSSIEMEAAPVEASSESAA